MCACTVCARAPTCASAASAAERTASCCSAAAVEAIDEPAARTALIAFSSPVGSSASPPAFLALSALAAGVIVFSASIGAGFFRGIQSVPSISISCTPSFFLSLAVRWRTRPSAALRVASRFSATARSSSITSCFCSGRIVVIDSVGA